MVQIVVVFLKHEKMVMDADILCLASWTWLTWGISICQEPTFFCSLNIQWNPSIAKQQGPAESFLAELYSERTTKDMEVVQLGHLNCFVQNKFLLQKEFATRGYWVCSHYNVTFFLLNRFFMLFEGVWVSVFSGLWGGHFYLGFTVKEFVVQGFHSKSLLLYVFIPTQFEVILHLY